MAWWDWLLLGLVLALGAAVTLGLACWRVVRASVGVTKTAARAAQRAGQAMEGHADSATGDLVPVT